MSQTKDQTLPAKCAKCNKPMASPLFCDSCKTLSLPTVGDYFSLFDLPRRFDLDSGQLRRKFLALSRHTHPDFHVSESAEVQQLALRISATINDAYRTLADPASRGAYLLELLGGRSSAEDKSVPDGFLQTMMMMQEELAEARTAGDGGEVERLGKVLRTQHEGLMRRVGQLFRQYDEAVGCEAVRNDVLSEIRRQLNAVSYVGKLLSQLE